MPCMHACELANLESTQARLAAAAAAAVVVVIVVPLLLGRPSLIWQANLEEEALKLSAEKAALFTQARAHVT